MQCNYQYIPRTNKAEQARLDISARGVWTSFDKSFFDVRVTHPNCLSNRSKPFQKIYEENEKEKKDEYNERVINVEKGNFNPLVFLTSNIKNSAFHSQRSPTTWFPPQLIAR